MFRLLLFSTSWNLFLCFTCIIRGPYSVLTFIFVSLQLVKQAILPRVHGLALKTTVAAVCLLSESLGCVTLCLLSYYQSLVLPLMLPANMCYMFFKFLIILS